MRVLTDSEIRCFRRCPREHYYAYELLRRPLERAQALRFGSAFHTMLEAWWLATGDDQRLPAALTKLDDADLDEFDRVRAEVLMRGYDARWGNEKLVVLAVEKQFETAGMAGKIDAIVRVDGLVYGVEHKTSGEDIGAGSSYWQRLRIDSQISTYYAALRSLGYEPAGFLYDVIGKPRLRPSKTQKREESAEEFAVRLSEHICEQPDRYYQRGTVVRLESEEREAAADVTGYAYMIEEARSECRRDWPRNPDQCIRYGRACSYFDVCTGAASIDDDTKFRRAETPHEELDTAKEERET